jgi:hypothetical protein
MEPVKLIDRLVSHSSRRKEAPRMWKCGFMTLNAKQRQTWDPVQLELPLDDPRDSKPSTLEPPTWKRRQR